MGPVYFLFLCLHSYKDPSPCTTRCSKHIAFVVSMDKLKTLYMPCSYVVRAGTTVNFYYCQRSDPEIGLLDNNKLINLGSMHLLFICMDGFSSTAHPLQKKPWTEWFQPAQLPLPKQLIASSHIYKDLDTLLIWNCDTLYMLCSYDLLFGVPTYKLNSYMVIFYSNR